MISEHNKINRKSIRLRGYDYSQAGAYYFTICTQNRKCLFGEVVDGKMVLNNAGEIVEKWYIELAHKFSDIQCGTHVIMPNHMHAIIHNVGADLRVCPHNQSGNENFPKQIQGEHTGSPLQRIVQWFKTMTTNEYIRGVKQHGWTSFSDSLWQRNYWERVIRNEDELNRIREYIQHNPMQWTYDEENPNHIKGNQIQKKGFQP